jgi:hypothetical protein
LHFFAFPATFLRHLFAAMLKALRACFAVLIFEPLSFEIRHFLNPGFTRVDRVLRLFTMFLYPGEDAYRVFAPNDVFDRKVYKGV